MLNTHTHSHSHKTLFNTVTTEMNAKENQQKTNTLSNSNRIKARRNFVEIKLTIIIYVFGYFTIFLCLTTNIKFFITNYRFRY